MTRWITRALCLPGVIILQLLFTAGYAQGNDLGQILTDKTAEGADVAALKAETNSFKTLEKGIALSLAMCAGVKNCKPNVNQDELEEIIKTLDARIGSIGQRYEDSGDKNLEGILLAYHNAKQNYSKYLDKLKTIVPEEKKTTADLFGQSDLFSKPATTAAKPDPFAIFNDVNEKIEDDTGDSETTKSGAAKQDQSQK